MEVFTALSETVETGVERVSFDDAKTFLFLLSIIVTNLEAKHDYSKSK